MRRNFDDQTKFKRILKEFLFPLFPGTEFDEEACVAPPLKNKSKLVTQLNTPAKLKLMLSAESDICCQIKRRQPFSEYEKKIIYNFLNKIKRLMNDYAKSYYKDTASSFLSSVVSSSVATQRSDVILKILSVMTEWSQQTYEGNQISFSMGIIQNEDHSATLNFDEICNEDFLKVLSNGHDTILIFDNKGSLLKHEALEEHQNTQSQAYSPIRFQRIANWTADDNKVAITLTRNGEILIFKEGCLVFAKRRGHWKFFSHSAVISQFTKNGMGRNTSETLRREIYLTALDIAFARAGGCLGVINASQLNSAMDDEKLISEEDMLEGSSQNPKAMALKKLVSGRNFQNIDRLLRLELASIDGATILDHNGKILTTGAILSVPGGSAGGGRQAATKAIAKHGLGIKISNDGYIKVLNRDGEVTVELA